MVALQSTPGYPTVYHTPLYSHYAHVEENVNLADLLPELKLLSGHKNKVSFHSPLLYNLTLGSLSDDTIDVH